MNFIILEILFLERGIWTLPGRSSPGARVGQFFSIPITTRSRLQKLPPIILLPLSTSFVSATLCWLWPGDCLWPKEFMPIWHKQKFKKHSYNGTFFFLVCSETWDHHVNELVQAVMGWIVSLTKFTCWSPDLQYLRMWLHLKMSL